MVAVHHLKPWNGGKVTHARFVGRVAHQTYAGFGSANTPTSVVDAIMKMARQMRANNWTLRVSALNHGDTAFERGANHSSTELYVPWRGFAGRSKDLGTVVGVNDHETIRDMTRALHPDWDAYSDEQRAVFITDVAVLLGLEADLAVDFAVMWADHPSIRWSQLGVMCKVMGIPLFNIAVSEDFKRLQMHLWKRAAGDRR